MANKSMVFYIDWLDTSEQFPTEHEQLQYILGILHYGLRDEAAEAASSLPYRIGYNSCKGSVATNKKKREGGALGGAPKGNTNHLKVETNQPMVKDVQPMVKTFQPTNNVNVNDKVNVNDNVNTPPTPSPGAVAIKRFVKPSIKEIESYCKERGNNINAASFYDYYESKGWKVGREPMKDWRAAVRNWERRRTEEGQPKRQLTYDELHPIGDFSNERTTI